MHLGEILSLVFFLLPVFIFFVLIVFLIRYLVKHSS